MRTTPRGFFGVAMYHPKTETNVGSLLRTASILGASFVATVGRRYRHQSSDTRCTPRHTPLFHFADFDDLYEHVPHGCRIVGVELVPWAVDLWHVNHPQQALYLLGAEDHGLPPDVLGRCHVVTQLVGETSLNVSVAGSIVLYHRAMQMRREVRAVA